MTRYLKLRADVVFILFTHYYYSRDISTKALKSERFASVNVCVSACNFTLTNASSLATSD